MLADLLWACAAAGHRDDAFLRAAAARLARHAHRLAADAEAQAKVVWALRELGFRDAALEAALAAAAPDAAAALSTSGGGVGGSSAPSG